MRSNKVRGAIAVLAAAVFMLMVAGSAMAASEQTLTTRSIEAADHSLTITVWSLGDAGALHGNGTFWTSPVDPSGNFYWFNKKVQVADFAFPDIGNEPTVLSGATIGINTGSGYTPQAEFKAPYIAEFDGVYSLVATGTDTVGEVSGEITPAFGIDQSDPVVSTDAVPFYQGTPSVTITATDTMSGVENVLFNVDGARSDSWEPSVSDPMNFSANFPFVGEGTHTFSWTAFDNAGNAAHGSETFAIDNTAPTTTSDLASSYQGAATIHLTAHDGSGSGVAHTYYILDGQPQVEGTTVNVPAPTVGSAPHTLEFWSEDAVGNVESPHVNGSFTVNYVKLSTSTTLKQSVTSIKSGGYVTLTAKLIGGTFAPGTMIEFQVMRPGEQHYSTMATIAVSSTGDATYKCKAVSKGTRYHRVKFRGNDYYLAAPDQHGLSLVVK